MESTSKPSDQGTLPWLIILAIILSLAVIFPVYYIWFLKKHLPRSVDVPHMSREGIADDQEYIVANHIETIISDSQLNDESPDSNREVHCAKDSVAKAGLEDSSVKVRSATK